MTSATSATIRKLAPPSVAEDPRWARIIARDKTADGSSGTQFPRQAYIAGHRARRVSPTHTPAKSPLRQLAEKRPLLTNAARFALTLTSAIRFVASVIIASPI